MRVLVIDDHELYRDGCRRLIEETASGSVVLEADTVAEGIARLEEDREIDLVCVSLEPQEEDPWSAYAELREAAGDTPIVVLADPAVPADALRALDEGAAGYLPKKIGRTLFILAIRLILAGGRYFPPELLRGRPARGNGGLAERSHGFEFPGAVEKLTRRQIEVLKRLAEGRTNREVAEELGLAEGTVKVHVAAIFKALGVRNRSQAVIAATRMGLGPD